MQVLTLLEPLGGPTRPGVSGIIGVPTADLCILCQSHVHQVSFIKHWLLEFFVLLLSGVWELHVPWRRSSASVSLQQLSAHSRCLGSLSRGLCEPFWTSLVHLGLYTPRDRDPETGYASVHRLLVGNQRRAAERRLELTWQHAGG
jgi:hypothetical protein